MAQYQEMKTKYPDAVLLFRVGDFYETFGDDAITASKVLGIVLTARNNGGDKTPLAGFPHHSLDIYLPKLVRSGYRVAICDQLEKPSKLKKLVKRGVTEVVTPGVTINDNILDHKSNNYLAAIHLGRKNQVGVAFLDISTGEFLVAEGDSMYIDKLLQSFQPAELLYSKQRKSDMVQRWAEHFYLYGVEEWVYTEDYTREKLLNQFGTVSLKGFGIEELELAQVAAGAILHYVATTENKNLKHIANIARIQPDKYVWLDRFTIRNLELVQATHPSGTPLVEVLDQTISAMGTRLLKKWMLLPVKQLPIIQARHEMVAFFVENEELRGHIGAHIRQISDLERLVSKVSLQRINPREVVQLGDSLKALIPIKESLAVSGNDGFVSISERINPCRIIQERIGEYIIEDAPVKIDKGGAIANGVDKELDELRDLIANSKKILKNIQEEEASNTGIDNLKIGFNNVFGYYLEVTNKYKNKGLVPEHWVRKQTLTNAERYITDDLKVLEAKILGAEEKILDLEKRLYESLVLSLADYIRPIQLNAALVAQLDALLSFAKTAILHNYVRPDMNDGHKIDIKAGRHPVIERQLKLGETFVPNNIYLDNEEQQILMITGPNMAGKSALLRQTALITLMAQMGSFVPADTASLGLIDKVFTRVGASDNISSGESTFMVEMNETASILNNVSDRSLILLDEIGRGTSTYDGISIAWSIAEFLHNHPNARPKTLFATHYHELNELAERLPRIKNYHIATKEVNNQVIFLRKLTAGGSEHSFGIHVAQMAGMPGTVVYRAQEILQQLEQKSIDVEDTRQKVKKVVQAIEPMQLSFFEAAPDPKWLKMKEELEVMNLNAMTPIDCMMKLNELKQKMLSED